MFYITLKEDWDADGIMFERSHYVFETKEAAEAYLKRKNFYKDSNNERYILEKGYQVLRAKIVELVPYTEPVVDETTESVKEPERPVLFIKEENQYTVVAKLRDDKQGLYVRMKKKVINGALYVQHKGQLIPENQWGYEYD